MQKSLKNSTAGTSRTGSLTNHARNASTALRNDVTKKYDWPNDAHRIPIIENPVIGYYVVNSDNQMAAHRHTIIPGDHLVAELITTDLIRPNKFYIVINFFGNVFLGRVNEVQPGRSIRLVNQNKAYKDTLIRRADIYAVMEVFQSHRLRLSIN